MNKGDRSTIDINCSEIKPVISTLAATTTTTQTTSGSSTITNLPPPLIHSVTIHSPTVPAIKHKDEEKRIQMVIYFS